MEMKMINKRDESKGLTKMEKLIKDQNGKMENNGKITDLKDENRDEKNDKRNYGNCYQCSATQLILYDLGVRNYSMVNESSFIGEFNELWIGDYYGWFKIVEY